MSKRDEDVLPTAYKYAWLPESELPLQDFLAKFKPSMVQNDGTKPWIWVQGSKPSKKDIGMDDAIKEAKNLLKEVTEKVENIKNDESIPLRSNKKTGAKSKKEVREQVQAEATEQLKEIAKKHGYVSGKWLIFAPADKVDMIWSSIATSLASGPLHSTAAFLAKVATASESEVPNAQHLICVYLPDVYDKSTVTEVMKILLRNHGVNLSGVKSDLYTYLGIDSKHPSGIPSTVWKNAAILPEKDSKELKDAYFAELASGKGSSTDAAAAPAAAVKQAESAPAPAKGKPKPKLKKKAEDDPFASGDDDEPEAPKVPAKAKKAADRKPKPQKESDPEDDDDGKSKKQKGKAVSKRTKKAEDVDDVDEDERPKKRRATKK
ncbi:hypothetical protein M413DRAFT_446456 [Hebeloma cylindrosporum]|uniref:Uncharacterized protein n=1 Tax=Hebeloma cylindrosporum TaxID=76867 RepID=A0A0C3BUB9_HEBCY|nr:hypothetical protein M413DRAFT_446456 [Hebeloma cylindrosporum h7]